ncbi:MAG: FAD-dependent monooxygenase [Bauldia sp.]|nr:FAD-dependent monooxygenase [Bauldia sp.]
MGIVGGGVAGLAAALGLARTGHDVTVLERRAATDPGGTGLLLQPFALEALRALGVREAVERRGARIGVLERFEDGAPVLRLRYDELAAGLFGVGIQRGQLHGVLLEHARGAGAMVYFGRDVLALEEHEDGVRLVEGGQRSELFDVLVVADGLTSRLRGQLPLAAAVRPCAWSVCTAVLTDIDAANAPVLRQYYRSADAFIGLLPVDPAAPGTISFFWNVPRTDRPSLPAAALHARRAELSGFFPPTGTLLAQLDPATELPCFSYAEVRMEHWHTWRCVVIGDAAHGLDPQLGLGANLALVDGMTLARCLAGVGPAEVATALADYQHLRAPTIRRLERANRFVVPLLQSDSAGARWMRRAVFGLARRSAPLRRRILGAVAGYSG